MFFNILFAIAMLVVRPLFHCLDAAFFILKTWHTDVRGEMTLPYPGFLKCINRLRSSMMERRPLRES